MKRYTDISVHRHTIFFFFVLPPPKKIKTNTLVHKYSGNPIHWYTGTAAYRYTGTPVHKNTNTLVYRYTSTCLLYTSDAADD